MRRFIISEDLKKYVVSVDKPKNTHLGKIEVKEENKIGDVVLSNKNKKFVVTLPSLVDMLDIIERGPQIIHPKDLGYILLKSGLKEGDFVLEIGTGNGFCTIALALIVSPSGKVYSFEKRREFFEKAKKNIKLFEELYDIKLNIELFNEEFTEKTEVFSEKSFDFCLVDINNPASIICKIKNLVRPGAVVCFHVLNVIQLLELLEELEKHKELKIDEICEIHKRNWVFSKKDGKIILRPEHFELSHTGYLIFVRKI